MGGMSQPGGMGPGSFGGPNPYGQPDDKRSREEDSLLVQSDLANSSFMIPVVTAFSYGLLLSPEMLHYDPSFILERRFKETLKQKREMEANSIPNKKKSQNLGNSPR